MRAKNYVLIFILVISSNLVVAQETVLCALHTEVFKIENSVNVPTATSNADDTFTLTFLDQNVTDVFANYVIYDFFQTFPEASQTLQKYYTIAFNSKDLIEDMIESVPSTTIIWTGFETETEIDMDTTIKSAITPELIEALDGKSFEVTKYISTSDECDPFTNNPSCYLVNVSNTFNFVMNFDFNAEIGLLHVENEELTSCGNAFSIDLAGGNPNENNLDDNILQLWDSTPEISALSDNSQPCHTVERIIFSVLDLACSPNNNDTGNFYVTMNSETGTIQFIRELAIFGYSIIELSQINLFVEDQIFEAIKLFEIKGNPYLQIANLNNQAIAIEILNTSGQQVLKPKSFEENSLNISNLSTGLYFIRVSNLNNQQKIFKFLKN